MVAVGILGEIHNRDVRLGRHIEHDDRSHAYPATNYLTDWIRPIEYVDWTRRGPILDQGELGSCTGNAAVGVLGTDNKYLKGSVAIDEALAVSVYEDATHLDSVPGSYPPDDTGSSGIAVMKVLKKRGLIKGYTHCFSFKSMCVALYKTSVIAGIAWRENSFDPDENGVCSWTGPIVGGHEIQIVGVDPVKDLVKFANSWGASWGQSGYGYFTFSDFQKALRSQGDVTVPVWR